MAENAPKAAYAAPPPSRANPPPEHEHSSGGFGVWIVLLVIVLIGGGLGYFIYTHRSKPVVKTPPPVSVSVTNVATGNIDETVEGLGTVTPVYTAMMSPRVDGQLVKVNFTEGQAVKANDLLAEIDPSPYQASLAQVQGQLARDKAQLEGANVDLKRFEEAYGMTYGTNLHAVPKQQVDDQRALVHQDEGTVQIDEGLVSNAMVQLNYCFVRAPFDGRVGLRQVDPGNIVHAANTNAIVVVAQLKPITVVFTVDQKHLPAIQDQLNIGHKMEVDASNEDKTRLLAKGDFLTMDNMIDTGTGTVRIKSMFENTNMALFPNQFVNAKLIVQTLTNVTLVPTPAIQRNPQGAFLYVITNKEVTLTNKSGTTQTNQTIVTMHPITVQIEDTDVSSVTGIEPGTVIVTDNFNKLGDGVQVNVRKRGAPGESKGEGAGAPAGQGPGSTGQSSGAAPQQGDHKGDSSKKKHDKKPKSPDDAP